MLQSCWESVILPSRGNCEAPAALWQHREPPSPSFCSDSILPPLEVGFVSFLLFLSRALLNLCAAPQLVCICVQTQLVFEPKKGKLEAMSYHPLAAVLLQTLALLGN